MPAGLNIDWSHVKSLYLQGLTVSEVAKEFGVKANTVMARAVRYGWNTERTQTRKKLDDSVVKRVTNTLADRAEHYISRQVNDVDRVMNALTSRRIPGSLDGLLEYERVMELLDKRARRTFGLSDGPSGNTLVNVQVLADVKEQPKSIDVQSETQHVEPEK